MKKRISISCLKFIQFYFSLSISAAASYVRKYFKDETKVAATALAEMIQDQFIDTLHTIPWMDDDSRAAAIVKANQMLLHVAYADELVDTNKLEEYFRGLDLTPDSLIHSLVQLHKFYDNRSINKLRRPVDKVDWETHSKATQVNAFYSPTENSICNIRFNRLNVIFFDKHFSLNE